MPYLGGRQILFVAYLFNRSELYFRGSTVQIPFYSTLETIVASLPRQFEHLPRGEVFGAVRGDDERCQDYSDQVVVEVILQEIERL